MKRKLLAALLIFAMLFTCVPAVALADASGDGYSFNSETGQLTISSDAGTTAWRSDDNINKSNLTSVVITDSVTSIGNNAFDNCSNLTSVTIGSRVESIGNSAFQGCSALTSVNIGSGVASIGQSAFADTALTGVVIPDSVTTIEKSAFHGCSNLAKITIGEKVASIGQSAFQNTALTSVMIPDSVTSIGQDAFRECSALTSVTIGSGVASIGQSAFQNTALTSVTIPDSVTSIGQDAFRECSALTSVTIENGVASIGKQAFRECTSLTSITIPASVTTIGEDAFFKCSALKSATIEAGVTTIGVGMFANTGLTSIVIPDSVTTIENYAFANTGLTSVTIPNGVTLGERVFPTTTAVIRNHTHDYNMSEYKSDETHHWYKCKNCDATDTKAVHSGGEATCTAKAECGVCGQPYGETAPHTYSEATCETVATCSCGATTGTLAAHIPNSDDGDCTTAILCSVCDTVTTAANTSHSYSQKYDSSDHWKDCDNCDVMTTKEAHSYGDDNICDVCSYTKPSTNTGGGGFSGTYNYPVSTPTVENGSVKLSDNNAAAGETVTITVTPDNGYGVAEVIATDEKGNVIPVTYLGNGEYSFVMPAGKVNIETVCKPAITLSIGNQMANVFGKNVKNDVAPIITAEGRTMLPIRFIAEALGADVSWNEAAQTVTITKDSTVVQIIIGADYAYINGEKVELDSPAFIANGRTYLPVRFVAEALGADVNWDAATQQVVIMK